MSRSRGRGVDGKHFALVYILLGFEVRFSVVEMLSGKTEMKPSYEFPRMGWSGWSTEGEDMKKRQMCMMLIYHLLHNWRTSGRKAGLSENATGYGNK